MGILLTPLTKLLISLGITSGHLAILNVQFMLDLLGLDLFASWLPIRFLSLLQHCYNSAIVQTIFTTQAAFHSIHKDVLPIFQQSNLIYKFQCCYNATYIGSTSQCPEVRVKQRVPKDIHNHTTFGHSKLLNSAVCEHLNSCVINYSNQCFVALHRARTKQHLIVLKAINILLNKSSLCKQNPKHSLNLFGDIFCLT